MCEIKFVDEEKINNVRPKLLNDTEVLDMVNIFKGFSDFTRFKIIHLLSLGEFCVCDIAAVLNISDPLVSHHLRQLRLLRIVKARKQGKMTYYSLDDAHILKILKTGIDHIRDENK